MVKKILRPPLLTAAFAACLFLTVLGTKWATFDRFGSAMPDWDQWDAEAYYLLTPWYENDHFFSHLFTPHNEHRVVVTKLQNLTLTVLNDQWDARLEATANAVLHSALATAFWLLAVRIFSFGVQRSKFEVRSSTLPLSPPPPLSLSRAFGATALWALAFTLFGLPLAWQNVTGGFHSQQYWLLVTSFTAIVTLPFARPLSPRWWLGAAAAILALFTMGSGLLASAAILVVLAFRLLRRETALRAAWPALALCSALVVAGLLTRIEPEYHAHMKAKTLHDFVFSLLHSLQWPSFGGREWLAAPMWLPWLLATLAVVRRSAGLRTAPSAPSPTTSDSPTHSRYGQIIVALGGWVLLQLLATAYARGAGADYPASRYMDTLTFGAMVNALCLAWLFSVSSSPSLSFSRSLPLRLSLATLTTAWLGTFAFGLTALLERTFDHELPDAKKYYLKAEAHLRGYLATDDPAQLAFPDIPYPSAQGLIDRLSRPSLRALMPTVVRAPLPLSPSLPPSVSPSPFAANHASQLSLPTAPRHGLSPQTGALASLPSWGSFDPNTGPAATGAWRSAPLTSPLGAYLKFETAGQLGASPTTLALELRDAQTDALLATVVPSKIPGDTWRAAYVTAPRVPFVVVARDQDPARWLAFSAPVEMGTLSYLALRATQHGLLLAQLSALTAAALALLLSRSKLKVRSATFKVPAPSTPPLPPAPLPSASPSPPLSLPPSLSLSLALAAALFLSNWGAKLIAIDHYGSDLPYWDQWAKEGDYLLTPWAERHELWKNLFLPHNEHRIAPTLALNLALVVGGGQWDARVQCAASAALHAALAAALFLWALRRFPRPWALATGAVLLLVTAPPLAWENVLGGFQSQFYFLAGFTFFALYALLSSPALSLRWWLGLVSSLFALVSMGSGLLLAAPLSALAFLRLVSNPTARRDTLLTLAVAVFIGGLGAALRTPAPWHDTLHAKTVAEFLLYAARCLSWPLPQHPWLAPLLWLPWLALLVLRLRSALRPSVSASLCPSVSPASDFLVAAGLWVLLQIAAVTYSRAAGGGYPASRYGDIAALGLPLSFAALATLATASRPPLVLGPWSLVLRFALPTLYLVVLATSVTVATRAVIAGPLPAKKKESFASERSVQAFILTDDYATFAKAPLPFPIPEWLARILRRPDIRTILPTSVRAPLALPSFSPTPTPPAPPLWERRTHSLLTAGEWRSAPLPPATFAYWKFEVTGPALASSPPSLLLSVSPSSPRTISPSRAPHPEEWRAAYVPAPTAPATLLARTASPERWLAFTEPVEMSALSYRTWQVAKHAPWLLATGLLAFCALAALALHPLLLSTLALRRLGEARTRSSAVLPPKN